METGQPEITVPVVAELELVESVLQLVESVLQLVVELMVVARLL